MNMPGTSRYLHLLTLESLSSHMRCHGAGISSGDFLLLYLNFFQVLKAFIRFVICHKEKFT